MALTITHVLNGIRKGIGSLEPELEVDDRPLSGLNKHDMIHGVDGHSLSIWYVTRTTQLVRWLWEHTLDDHPLPIRHTINIVV